MPNKSGTPRILPFEGVLRNRTNVRQPSSHKPCFTFLFELTSKKWWFDVEIEEISFLKVNEFSYHLSSVNIVVRYAWNPYLSDNEIILSIEMENKLRFLMLKYLGDRRLRILPYKIFNTLHLYLADLRPAIVTKIVRFIWILNSTITHLKDSAWNDEARDLSPDWSINMTYKSSRSYVVKIFGPRPSMHVIGFQRPCNMKCKRCIIDWARLQVHFLLNQSLLSKVSVTFQNLKHWKNKNLDNLCFSSVSFSQDSKISNLKK